MTTKARSGSFGERLNAQLLSQGVFTVTDLAGNFLCFYCVNPNEYIPNSVNKFLAAIQNSEIAKKSLATYLVNLGRDITQV